MEEGEEVEGGEEEVEEEKEEEEKEEAKEKEEEEENRKEEEKKEQKEEKKGKEECKEKKRRKRRWILAVIEARRSHPNLAPEGARGWRDLPASKTDIGALHDCHHVINFRWTRKQFAFEKFCWHKLKEHIKIRLPKNFQPYISKVAIVTANES